MHPRASDFLPDRGVIFHLGMLVKATHHQSNGYTPISHAHPTARQIVDRLSVDDKSDAQIDTRFPSRSRQPARGFGSPAAVAGLLGTVLGLLADYIGGWVDTLISRLVDIWMAFRRSSCRSCSSR